MRLDLRVFTIRIDIRVSPKITTLVVLYGGPNKVNKRIGMNLDRTRKNFIPLPGPS